MKNIFNKMKYGGICDMTLWKWFSKDKSLVLSSLQDFDNSYDHAIRDCKQWKSKKVSWERQSIEIKQIEFINGECRCFNLESNKHQKMKTLHFQGGPAKVLLGDLSVDLIVSGHECIL